MVAEVVEMAAEVPVELIRNNLYTDPFSVHPSLRPSFSPFILRSVPHPSFPPSLHPSFPLSLLHSSLLRFAFGINEICTNYECSNNTLWPEPQQSIAPLWLLPKWCYTISALIETYITTLNIGTLHPLYWLSFEHGIHSKLHLFRSSIGIQPRFFSNRWTTIFDD